MQEIAAWIAPAATMIAAMMTASNLGAKVTGWGFIVFTIGSLGWIAIAVGTDQSNLLWTNGFLTIVNGVGIWRWLGRQARYEDGGHLATVRSAAAQVPTLFAVGSMAGAKLLGRDGVVLGVVVEGMMQCKGSVLAYVVVSEGGVAGVGERLHALAPDELTFTAGHISCDLDAATLAGRAVLAGDNWPLALS